MYIIRISATALQHVKLVNPLFKDKINDVRKQAYLRFTIASYGHA